ncbi:hypothetical protein ACFWXO_41410 [Kitasatospora sp. NPDC059088]|uniref:hypothetical protein n=1 Tax=Kitasatospora sp. NPDC059088 TaxID=3346722 RepID=UPI00368299F9
MSDASYEENVAPIPATEAAPPEPAQEPRLRPWKAPAVFAAAGLVVGAGAVGLAWGLSGPGDDEPFTLVGQARISTSDPTKSGT